MRNPHHVPKIKVEVDLLMTDGGLLRGFVYIRANERVMDLLNGTETFVAFQESETHEITLLNKTSIAGVKPLDQRG